MLIIISVLRVAEMGSNLHISMVIDQCWSICLQTA